MVKSNVNNPNATSSSPRTPKAGGSANKPRKQTALMSAAKSGSADRLRSLLLSQEGGALDADHNGLTALMWAANFGREACVRLLLASGGALTVDRYGWTALMGAARFGSAPCIQLLLPFSDALAKDSLGGTALMHAAACGSAACVALLLPASSFLDRTVDGDTASDIARQMGNPTLADLIDAHALALRERASIQAATSCAAPARPAPKRV